MALANDCAFCQPDQFANGGQMELQLRYRQDGAIRRFECGSCLRAVTCDCGNTNVVKLPYCGNGSCARSLMPTGYGMPDKSTYSNVLTIIRQPDWAVEFFRLMAANKAMIAQEKYAGADYDNNDYVAFATYVMDGAPETDAQPGTNPRISPFKERLRVNRWNGYANTTLHNHIKRYILRPLRPDVEQRHQASVATSPDDPEDRRAMCDLINTRIDPNKYRIVQGNVWFSRYNRIKKMEFRPVSLVSLAEFCKKLDEDHTLNVEELDNEILEELYPTDPAVQKELYKKYIWTFYYRKCFRNTPVIKERKRHIDQSGSSGPADTDVTARRAKIRRDAEAKKAKAAAAAAVAEAGGKRKRQATKPKAKKSARQEDNDEANDEQADNEETEEANEEVEEEDEETEVADEEAEEEDEDEPVSEETIIIDMVRENGQEYKLNKAGLAKVPNKFWNLVKESRFRDLVSEGATEADARKYVEGKKWREVVKALIVKEAKSFFFPED